MEIVQLTDKNSDCIPIICRWLYYWWGKDEGFSTEKMEAYIKNSLCEDRLPQTFVLLEKSELVGVYQLSVMDIDVRPDVYPWLINVYISNRHRGSGFLKEIMKEVKKTMKKLGLSEIYLYTKHEGLYERFGFEYMESFKTFIKEDDIQRLYRMKI